MYPNLYYAFKDLFGVNWTGLRFINSFGFFVALAFIGAAWTLTLELKRKSQQGLLHSEEQKIVIGQPASTSSLLLNFVLGFLLGYKIIGAFFSNAENPQEFIFSSQGNWIAGILLGGLFAFIKWYEKNKQKLAKPEERIIRIWPHDRVGDLVIFAAIFGFAGAKIFHNLENWDELMRDPVGSLLSFSGLTFYGGLICAALAIWWYAKKHSIGFWHLNDAAAPALMLAYAIGRIGCMVAGDGDWGIANTKPNPFSWLPNWMWSFRFPHNVIGEGVQIPGCVGQYCAQLPEPVYPTPFYETVMCLILFAFLWSIRKKVKTPGILFSIYLIVNGIERFLIEKIRVNTKYNIDGFHPTQAEIISFLMVITGIALIVYLSRKKPVVEKVS
ncbi:prolipoprotein diacylglyceryl transferase [Pinibacter aurantiacus]|uniref:Prolipoprotein diacylglyceryl transferase n=1 Tax=Pinibacter aurantiacus TaxID=2851599 RepID=A0A9E2W9J2_9BACT|nr:prolipoprotein diacylglyceryl transferase family protein [Pinibacter aurantiacus]MBV4360136.1 prolipoprotein diacylglyceryl transferase [Pinibacter aurantiacus]